MNGDRLFADIAFALCIAPVVGACGDGHSVGSRVSAANVRDSAGVTIVENTAAAWSVEDQWIVAESPRLEIGAVEGAQPALFSRINDVKARADGAIVVADGGTNEVRFFDHAGEHFATAGGSGNGPQEFRMLARLQVLAGDSVAAMDQLRRRVIVFDANAVVGRVLEVAPVAAGGGFLFPAGLVQDCSYIMYGIPAPTPPDFGPAPAFAPWYRVSPDGKGLDTLAKLPAAVVATDAQGRSRPIFPRPDVVNGLASDGVWYGIATGFELRKVGLSGTLDRIVRVQWEPVVLTRSDVDRVASWHQQIVNELSRLAPNQPAVPQAIVRDTFPLFSRLLVDRPGNVWVDLSEPTANPADWIAGALPGSRGWTVFTAMGEWLGDVMMPAGFTPYDIGEDYVLGVAKDSLGVEFVRLYELEKGSRARPRTAR